MVWLFFCTANVLSSWVARSQLTAVTVLKCQPLLLPLLHENNLQRKRNRLEEFVILSRNVTLVELYHTLLRLPGLNTVSLLHPQAPLATSHSSKLLRTTHMQMYTSLTFLSDTTKAFTYIHPCIPSKLPVCKHDNTVHIISSLYRHPTIDIHHTQYVHST